MYSSSSMFAKSSEEGIFYVICISAYSLFMCKTQKENWYLKNWLIIFLSAIQRLIIFLSVIQRLIIFLSAIQRLIIFLSAIQRLITFPSVKSAFHHFPKCESARYLIFFSKTLFSYLLQFLDMKRIISWYVLIISVINMYKTSRFWPLV